MAGRIGVGITTRNRRDVLEATLLKFIDLTSYPGFKIVIVDDASETPYKPTHGIEYFRFPFNVGIARAKNKCLELLDDCEHVFLFDDDTYPRCQDWWKPYIENGQPHLMYQFGQLASGYILKDGSPVYNDGKTVAWTHPRGCMLYMHRSAIDAVGGFDPAFGAWGWEHVNYSDRIHAAGLTNWAYQDVVDSHKFIFSGDEAVAVVSTVPPSTTRAEHLARSTAVYKQYDQPRSYYVEYRDQGKKDFVLTSYFTDMMDVQRNKQWFPDPAELVTLQDSVAKIAPNAELVLLSNSLGTQQCPVGTTSPYWQRWVAIYDWLRLHPEARNVWCVDATDVEMLRNPFGQMKPGVLYVGCEPVNTGIPWMYNMHKAKFIQDFIRVNMSKTLLNCGVVGGSREMVMEFIRSMLKAWAKNKTDVHYQRDNYVGETDMGLFNYICRTHFAARIVHGSQVVTQFKSYRDNGEAWWRHK